MTLRRLIVCCVVPFIVSGPVPSNPYRPSAEPELPIWQLIQRALGKSHVDVANQRVRERIGAAPIASYGTNFGALVFDHLFPEHGIELSFNEDGLLRAAFFYSNHKDFGKYRGPLPKGLSFQHTPEQVAKVLGAPEEIIPGRAGQIVPLPTVYHYPSIGLSVGFDAEKFGQKLAKIVQVTIFPSITN